MGTLISSTPRPGRLGLAGGVGRRAGGLAVSLLAIGALAAGCGSAHVGTAAAGTGSAGTGSAGRGSAGPEASSTASGAAAGGTPGHATGPAAPPASATPVPTVTGGPVTAGGIDCAGWPTGATSVSLPVSFVPVSVERCVNGAQTIPGKGLWATATLQRADSDLTGLVSALRRPSPPHRPGTVCPALAIIPPHVVLISASGQKLIPRLPVSGCGLVQSQVLAALNELRWQTVSVRLISRIPGATAPTASATAPTAPGTAPHSIQTVSGTQPR